MARTVRVPAGCSNVSNFPLCNRCTQFGDSNAINKSPARSICNARTISPPSPSPRPSTVVCPLMRCRKPSCEVPTHTPPLPSLATHVVRVPAQPPSLEIFFHTPLSRRASSPFCAAAQIAPESSSQTERTLAKGSPFSAFCNSSTRGRKRSKPPPPVPTQRLLSRSSEMLNTSE